MQIQYGKGPAFPSGTKMLFVQTAAPTGWTKDTDQNDKALRIVSGTASTGGSSAFSTVFGKTATDAHTLTTAQMPTHTHLVYAINVPGYYAGSSEGGGSDTVSSRFTRDATGVSGYIWKAGPDGGSGSHTHNIDIRVQYVDVIKATKD